MYTKYKLYIVTGEVVHSSPGELYIVGPNSPGKLYIVHRGSCT
jgi:hypothetical protein